MTPKRYGDPGHTLAELREMHARLNEPLPPRWIGSLKPRVNALLTAWDVFSALITDIEEKDARLVGLETMLVDARREIGELKTRVADMVLVERTRCAEIVELARFGEMDQDFRSIIHAIEGGESIETIKSRSRP